MQQKCGYIALLGRPNAGKSTLLNALLGEKLAVVSRRPQTTRNRILGVYTAGETQVLFLDTPGIHRTNKPRLLNKAMISTALAAAADADLVLYLIDVTHGWHEQDGQILTDLLARTGKRILVLATKIDTQKKDQVQARLSAINTALTALVPPELSGRFLLPEAMPVSAKRPEAVQRLRTWLAGQMPEGPWMFDEDDLTDLPRQFICAELIREQVFRQIGDEIPYGCAVKVESIEFKPSMVVLRAVIYLDRKSHKPIVLGAKGDRIKAIGTEARMSLEKHFGQKVFLDLGVRISTGWMDDKRLLAELANLPDADQLLS